VVSRASFPCDKDRILRRIFGPEREEMTVEWSTLHNGWFHSLYSSPNIKHVIKSRRARWAQHVAHTGEKRGAYRVLVGKCGRHVSKPENNIKMDI
jgi:hypothetical protein